MLPQMEQQMTYFLSFTNVMLITSMDTTVCYNVYHTMDQLHIRVANLLYTMTPESSGMASLGFSGL